jgi:hypothetical protein
VTCACAHAGVYWDKHGGCLRGEWAAGVLAGAGTYEQPDFRLEASFTAGLPDGAAAFTTVATRALADRRAAPAAAHLRRGGGPVLRAAGTYALPPGAAAPPALDEDGNPVEDEGRPALPSAPHYNGLAFTAAAAPPSTAAASKYPPTGCAPPACIKAPTFSMATGVTAP